MLTLANEITPHKTFQLNHTGKRALIIYCFLHQFRDPIRQITEDPGNETHYLRKEASYIQVAHVAVHCLH